VGRQVSVFPGIFAAKRSSDRDVAHPVDLHAFAGEPRPLTTAMLDASIPRRFASRATTASVARPMRTFRDQAQRKTTRDLGLRPP
jgi:hypothetical protein